MRDADDKFSGLPRLNLPPVDLRIIREDGLLKVYDPLRNKFVALTPEEYVRQHYTAWLISDRHYRPQLMANEIAIDAAGRKRRCDTVIFRPDGSPLVIVEYKAPNIKITQHTFDQIVRYNMVLHADFLAVSNGFYHYCCKIDYAASTYHFIPVFPDYNDLSIPFSEN